MVTLVWLVAGFVGVVVLCFVVLMLHAMVNSEKEQ